MSRFLREHWRFVAALGVCLMLLLDSARSQSLYSQSQPVVLTDAIGNTAANVTAAGASAANAVPIQGVTGGIAIPISGSVTIGSNASVNVNQVAGSAVTTAATGEQLISADQHGTWNITNVSGTVSLPTGASTSSLQTSGNSTLTSISGQLPSALDGSGFLKTHEQGTASVSGTVTSNQGGSNWSMNLSQVAGNTTVTGGANGLLAVAGQVADNAAIGTQNPLLLGANGSTKTRSLLVESDTAQNLRVALYNGTTEAKFAANGGLAIEGIAGGVAVPVSGTVTTTPPNNASTNIAQWAGNTAVTGGTNGSVGVGGLAADGAALAGNPLLLGAKNGSNIQQLSTDGSNNLNVKLAAGSNAVGTVQPGNTANTTPWLMKLNDGTNAFTVRAGSSLPAASDTAVVVTERDTVTVSGTVTTTPPSNASTNVAQWGATNVLTGGSNGSVGVGGLAARTTVVTGNPLWMAGSDYSVACGGGTDACIRPIPVVSEGQSAVPNASVTIGGWDAAATAARMMSVQGDNSTAPTRGDPVVLPARYDSTYRSLTNGNVAQPALDASGRLITGASLSAGTGQIIAAPTFAAPASNASRSVCWQVDANAQQDVLVAFSSTATPSTANRYTAGERDCKSLLNTNAIFFAAATPWTGALAPLVNFSWEN